MEPLKEFLLNLKSPYYCSNLEQYFDLLFFNLRRVAAKMLAIKESVYLIDCCSIIDYFFLSMKIDLPERFLSHSK